MSDFVSRRQMRSSGMYSECLRPIDVEHVLTLCLPHAPGRTLRLNFYRGAGPGFSQRDRDLLTILRPHLDLIYRSQCRRRDPLPALTPREWEVLGLVAAGRTNRQISRQLSISEATVRKHLEHVYARLGVNSRMEATNRVFGVEARIEPR
jgi:DNA-binding CsgD family transcriptional regulator